MVEIYYSIYSPARMSNAWQGLGMVMYWWCTNADIGVRHY